MQTFALAGDKIRHATREERHAGLHDDRLVQMTADDEPIQLDLPGVPERAGGIWLYAIYRRPQSSYRIIGQTAAGVVCGQWIVARMKQAAQVGDLAEVLTRQQSQRANGVKV